MDALACGPARRFAAVSLRMIRPANDAVLYDKGEQISSWKMLGNLKDYSAQQESLLRSLLNPWAQRRRPSPMDG